MILVCTYFASKHTSILTWTHKMESFPYQLKKGQRKLSFQILPTDTSATNCWILSLKYSWSDWLAKLTRENQSDWPTLSSVFAKKHKIIDLIFLMTPGPPRPTAAHRSPPGLSRCPACPQCPVWAWQYLWTPSYNNCSNWFLLMNCLNSN